MNVRRALLGVLGGVLAVGAMSYHLHPLWWVVVCVASLVFICKSAFFCHFATSDIRIYFMTLISSADEIIIYFAKNQRSLISMLAPA